MFELCWVLIFMALATFLTKCRAGTFVRALCPDKQWKRSYVQMKCLTPHPMPRYPIRNIVIQKPSFRGLRSLYSKLAPNICEILDHGCTFRDSVE